MSDDRLAPGLFVLVRGVFATLQGASLRVEFASVELDEQIAYRFSGERG